MAADNSDYYKDLGVPPDADEKEIAKAYRNLAKKYHPDIYKGADAEERFKKINGAYEKFIDEKEKIASLFQSAENHANAGRYEEALYDYEGIVGLKPNHLEALKGKSAILFKLQRYAKAITVYDKILLKNPNDSDIWNSKGEALSFLGNHNDAVKAYDSSLRINPDNIQVKEKRNISIRKIKLSEKSKSFKSPPFQATSNVSSSDSLSQKIPEVNFAGRTTQHTKISGRNLSGLGLTVLLLVFVSIIFIFIIMFTSAINNGSYTLSTPRAPPMITPTPMYYSNSIRVVTPGITEIPSSTSPEYLQTPKAQPTPKTHIVGVSASRIDDSHIIVTYQGGVDSNALIGLRISGSGMVPSMIGSTSGNIILPFGSSKIIPATEMYNTIIKAHNGKIHVMVTGFFNDGVEEPLLDNYI